MNTYIEEMGLIDSMTANFERSPLQLNGPHEADAELIRVSTFNGSLLAATTDTVGEEIAAGLYDPYLAGWMVVTSNLSDLAAVGAEPLGILVSITVPSLIRRDEFNAIGEGIADACREHGIHVLGGDLNMGSAVSLTGSALGIVQVEKKLTRYGAQPGDSVYMTGPGGLGNAFALLKVNGNAGLTNRLAFRPLARLDEGKLVRNWATSCIDTSDGVISAVDTLARVNNRHIRLSAPTSAYIHESARQICQRADLPSWLALAGVHGEYELCFTVARNDEDNFLKRAEKLGWTPLRIGIVEVGEGVSLTTEEGEWLLDTALLRNLGFHAGDDPSGYVQALLMYGERLGLFV